MSPTEAIENRAYGCSPVKLLPKGNCKSQFREDQAFIKAVVGPWVNRCISRGWSDEKIKQQELYPAVRKLLARAWKLRYLTKGVLFPTKKGKRLVMFTALDTKERVQYILTGVPTKIGGRVYLSHKSLRLDGWVVSELSSGALVPTIAPQPSRKDAERLAKEDPYLQSKVMVIAALICVPYINQPLDA